MEQQANNPSHGVTLEMMVTQLVEEFGWAGLAKRIKIRCFEHDPSVKSSLKFLRKTPWARDKVESLYHYWIKCRAKAARAADALQQGDSAAAESPPESQSQISR